MVSDKDFKILKQNSLDKLKKAISEDKVDKKILPILKIINSYDQYYTTSSCAGRIVILQIPSIGDKKQARFLGKWHRLVNLEEVNASFKKSKKGQIWILAQSPIIHVGVKTSQDADILLKKAVLSGFKHSAYKSQNNKIILEICSTERLDAPIGENNEIYCNEKHLSLLIKISNEIITKSNNKLIAFKSNIASI